jgi:hypothetical protein
MPNQTNRFEPPRRSGLLFQGGVSLALAVMVFLLFSQALLAKLGPQFLLYLAAALALAVPLPVILYRLVALVRSGYTIDRNGVRLQWGLRAEDIPMSEVLWVKDARAEPLNLPRLRWPGALVGLCRQPDNSLVEFMASQTQKLVLIGTPERVYAVSPEDFDGFLRAFRYQIEMGSLTPLRTFSAQPTFLFADIWQAPAARTFLVVALVLALALFTFVGFAIPNVAAVSLGFTPSGAPLQPVPSVQLLLLPALYLLLAAGAFILSMYFHRLQPDHPLLYVLWISTTFTGLVMLLAVYVILRIS